MTLAETLEQALHSTSPLQALRAWIEELISQGMSREDILGIMEKARRELRQSDREKEEETLMDAMDWLVDWCSPHMRLVQPPQSMFHKGN